jgi:transketolase
MKKTIEELKKISNESRKQILQMTTEAGSGHIAGAMGIIDVVTYLYFNEMSFNKVEKYFDEGVQRDSILDPNRDRLILSAAHMVPSLYATLSQLGFIDPSELMNLRSLGSKLQGHTNLDLEIGIETSGGSLGQGVGIAAGLAKSFKIYDKKSKVFCIVGDGESNEGSVWEAFMFSSKYKLDNLIYIFDHNNIQQSNFGDQIMPLLDIKAKLTDFGLQVIEIDGNDFSDIERGFNEAHEVKGKPICILANTIPGKGVSFIEHNYIWHSKPLDKEQLKEALNEL